VAQFSAFLEMKLMLALFVIMHIAVAEDTGSTPQPTITGSDLIISITSNATAYTNQSQGLSPYSAACQTSVNSSIRGIQSTCSYQTNIFAFYAAFMDKTSNDSVVLTAINNLLRPYCSDLNCFFKMASNSNSVIIAVHM
jgi:hypothetical protein